MSARGHGARGREGFHIVPLPTCVRAAVGVSWNHWATVPATFVIAFFLFGIEEIGIQVGKGRVG